MGTSKFAEVVRRSISGRENRTGERVTLRQLAVSTGYSYEHIRKILQGAPCHSRGCSDAISHVLGLDPDQLWDLARVDKLSARWGAAVATLPRDTRLVEFWKKLSDNDRESLIRVAEGLVVAASAEKAKRSKAVPVTQKCNCTVCRGVTR